MREALTSNPTTFEAPETFGEPETVTVTVGELTREMINSYAHIIVAFSGGKDSLCCLLQLFELGVERSKIELWHHDIDGREGGKLKMDWPCTPDYCRAVAEAFGIPIYFSWKNGGFEGEMLRENARTRPTSFEVPGGEVKTTGGTRGKKSTRRKFPQAGKDLTTRWCSPYLKIDVCATAINNQERFLNKKTLLITGERAEESPGRAKYKRFEIHKSDNRNGKRAKRHVDQYRIVHQWKETEIWPLIEKYRVNPHPCYRLGFNRCSCLPCIFGNGDQWASVKKLAPETFEQIAGYEDEFSTTIDRKVPVRLKVIQPHKKTGRVPRAYEMKESDIRAGMSKEWTETIILKEGEWTLPSGAYKKEGGGPV